MVSPINPPRATAAEIAAVATLGERRTAEIFAPKLFADVTPSSKISPRAVRTACTNFETAITEKTRSSVLTMRGPWSIRNSPKPSNARPSLTATSLARLPFSSMTCVSLSSSRFTSGNRRTPMSRSTSSRSLPNIRKAFSAVAAIFKFASAVLPAAFWLSASRALNSPMS